MSIHPPFNKTMKRFCLITTTYKILWTKSSLSLLSLLCPRCTHYIHSVVCSRRAISINCFAKYILYGLVDDQYILLKWWDTDHDTKATIAIFNTSFSSTRSTQLVIIKPFMLEYNRFSLSRSAKRGVICCRYLVISAHVSSQPPTFENEVLLATPFNTM